MVSTGKSFGSHLITFSIGGADLPDPIGMTLLGLEEIFVPKYWEILKKPNELREQLCGEMTLEDLPKKKKCLVEALKDYPAYRSASCGKGRVISFVISMCDQMVTSEIRK